MDAFYGKKGKGKGKPHFWKGGGGSRFGHANRGEDFQGKHVLDAETAMQSTTKVPPAWDPRLEKRGYPFRIWLLDVAMWRIGSEVPDIRQGAAVAQRLGGVAKVLARHIPPENLRDGTQVAGPHGQMQQLDGLSLLIRGLTRRFGGFAEETAQHSIVELLAFRRLGSESVDDALGRFETLHATATEVAGFDMGHGALSWMLLTAMEIPRPAWPLLLAPTGGTFPVDTVGFSNLMLAIRRQGHIAEHTHAGPTTMEEGQRRPGGTGNYFWDGDDFGQAGPSSSFFGASEYSGDPTADAHWFHGGGSSSDTSGYYDGHAHEYYYDDGGHTVCSTCSQYWYDDHDDYNDTDTEDEFDESMMDHSDLSSYYGSFDGCTEQSLRQEYLFAKRRFRRFTGKQTRDSRFPRRPASWDLRFGGKRGGKGKGKGKYYAGFPFGPSSLAGGKGKNKGKGRGNPTGKDGQQMKCHGCGSTDHLIMQCPTGKGKGSFNFAAAGESTESHVSGPLAGLAMQSSWFVDTETKAWTKKTVSLSEAIPESTGFESAGFDALSRMRAALSSEPHVGGDDDDYDDDDNNDEFNITDAAGYGFWMNLLAPRSSFMVDEADVSRECQEVSSTIEDLNQRFGYLDLEDSRELDSRELWSPPVDETEFFTMNTPSPSLGTLRTTHDDHYDDDHHYTTTTTTTSAALTVDDYSTQAAAVGASLFLPWWEEKTADEHYLVRTSMKSRSGEGLLVDPGSPDNLVGSGWSKRMNALMTDAGGPAATYVPHYLEVGGVGQGAQTAHSKVTHHIVCPTVGGPSVAGTFTAPELESDKVPALLGLKALTRMKGIMDMGTNRLIVPGPGGVEMRLSPGTVVYPLEPTHSGHLLLPCSEFGRRPGGETITLLSGVNAADTVVAETATVPSRVEVSAPVPASFP